MKPQSVELISPPDGSKKTTVQFDFLQKIIGKTLDHKGQAFPGLEDSSALITVCPSYTYDFQNENITLVMEDTITEARIDALLSHKIGRWSFLVGYAAAWTHFFIAYAVSKEPPKELVSFDEIKALAIKAASEEEVKLNTRIQAYLKKHVSSHTPLVSTGEETAAMVTLSSELKSHQKLYERMLATYNGPSDSKAKSTFYRSLGIEEANAQLFNSKVNICIRPTKTRFLKPLFDLHKIKGIHCRVLNPNTGKAFDFEHLVDLMMSTHVILEMSHFYELIDRHKVHFILHEGSRKKDSASDALLRNGLLYFKPEVSTLGQWIPISFSDPKQRTQSESKSPQPKKFKPEDQSASKSELVSPMQSETSSEQSSLSSPSMISARPQDLQLPPTDQKAPAKIPSPKSDKEPAFDKTDYTETLKEYVLISPHVPKAIPIIFAIFKKHPNDNDKCIRRLLFFINTSGKDSLANPISAIEVGDIFGYIKASIQIIVAMLKTLQFRDCFYVIKSVLEFITELLTPKQPAQQEEAPPEHHVEPPASAIPYHQNSQLLYGNSHKALVHSLGRSSSTPELPAAPARNGK